MSINKPIDEVLRGILEYTDPDSQLHIFRLLAHRDNGDMPLFFEPRLENFPTLQGDDSFYVVYCYHTQKCPSRLPDDPKYLDGNVTIGEILQSPTRVKWRPMQSPSYKPVYERLEALL